MTVEGRGSGCNKGMLGCICMPLSPLRASENTGFETSCFSKKKPRIDQPMPLHTKPSAIIIIIIIIIILISPTFRHRHPPSAM
jgi:hypothetical protein